MIHSDKHGIDRETAEELCAFLNTKTVDDYFRAFSGHTQVNATDLRTMKFPSREQLRALGRARMHNPALNTEDVLSAMEDDDACPAPTSTKQKR